MGIKSTRTVDREFAIEVLLETIPNLDNESLGMMLDTLADTKASERISICDNFYVKEINTNG